MDKYNPERSEATQDSKTPELGAVAQRIILDEFMPQWAVVNDELQVLELSDNVSRYLNVGAGSIQNNIVRLAQNSLQSGLCSLLQQPRQERQKVVHDSLLLCVEDGLKRVTLTVQPIPGIGCDDELLMVIFQESGALISSDQASAKSDSDGQFRQSQSMIFQLEKELSSTQADLARTVQDLEAANDDLENLLISSQTATLFLDDDFRVQWFTPAVCDIYNLIDGDVGRSILDITHNVEYMPVLPRQAQLDSTELHLKEQVQTLNGHCYLRRVLPYRRADNQSSGVVVIFTDITHMMAAEQFTRNVINSLRSFVCVCSTDGTLLQANQSALIAAGISYADVFGKPFRETPWWNTLPESQRLLDEAILRAAAGESSRFDVEIILKGNEKATVDFQIEPMRSSDGSITHLIPSAIDITHRRQREVALELAELKSRSLLQEIEDIYNSAPIGLCVHDLETDPTRLRQVLINLTGNAVKFTEQGSVTLRVEYRETPEPCLFFHVIDTGIGMMLEQQAEVFAAFRQADSSISRRFGGSGLGLAISQRLAASMGGKICIHSEPGKGSTLTLKLPAGELGQVLLATPEKPVAVDGAEALQIPELPYRLLAVDDRPDILHVVQHFLENAGATVLRERGFNKPIIALTANVMKGELEKCLAAGCTDYPTKPIDRHLLIEALDRHVAHPQISQKDEVSKQCILLVEDHVESAQVLVRLLERSGHTVHSAHSAVQAMSALESIQPTVILSDIGLPDEDGYSLVARMRQHPGMEGCVFVALTGSSELDEIHQNVFDHHITKPVEIERLREFLRQPARTAVITG